MNARATFRRLLVTLLGIAAVVGSLGAAPANGKMRLALLRGRPAKWDVAGNFAVLRAAVAEAAAQKADLLVTPECWLDGYATTEADSTPQRVLDTALSADSPYLVELGELARQHGVWICCGFTAREQGRAFNAAALWNSTGVRVGTYHKIQLAGQDLQYEPGDKLPVFESPWGPLGIVICADRRWPENMRVIRLEGARLILNPSYGNHDDLNEAMMRTRAAENECFVAFAHPDEGLVTAPNGKIVAKAEGIPPAQESWTLLITDIDLSATRERMIKSRRAELYGPLQESKKTR